MTIQTPRQTDAVAEHQRRTAPAGSDRPHAGAADEMHDGKDAAANELGRIFARIREGERLLGAEPDAGDKAADHQQRHGRRKRAQDREDAEQQQVELINELRPNRSLNSPWPAVPMAMPKMVAAADDRGLSPRTGKFGLDDERDQRPEHGEVDDVEEISGGDEPDDAAMQRRDFRIVQGRADECLRLSGPRPSSPYRPLDAALSGHFGRAARPCQCDWWSAKVGYRRF